MFWDYKSKVQSSYDWNFFNLGPGFYFSSLVASALRFVLVIEFAEGD